MEKIINEESDYFVNFLKSFVGKPYHLGVSNYGEVIVSKLVTQKGHYFNLISLILKNYFV